MTTEFKDDVDLRLNEDGIHILYMNTEENRFNPTFIKKIHKALDKVEEYKKSTCLITISTSQKIWSNGVDLNWIRDNPDHAYTLFQDFVKLVGRLYIFPVPTIAAINGHAFAGGLMWALGHDYRFM